MFTGLIEAVGRLAERTALGVEGCRIRIRTGLGAELRPGDSLAVNGVCLTVRSADEGSADADVGPETLRVTTLGRLPEGALLNLERPLRADGRIGGHLVLGHVDAVGEIVERRPAADFDWFTVRFPSDLAPYLVPKGSVAVDGISLTVATLRDGAAFDVQIVPYTLEHTNLHAARPGDPVNLECDVIGKYVVRTVERAWSEPHARGAAHPRADR